MADFPSSIFAPRTTENLPGIDYDPDNSKTQFAEDYSLPAAEIEAIEAILGLNPQGDFDTVAEWLAALQAAVDAGSFDPTRLKYNIVPSGTVDGSNAVFTLPEDIVVDKLAVFVDGVRLNPNVSPTPEWTYNAGTRQLTTYVAPQSWVMVDYISQS